jgi:head-tail adaptor
MLFTLLQTHKIMLSIIHKKACQNFLDLLVQLENDFQQQFAQSESIWAELSELFQQQIISLTDEDLEEKVASGWISWQTEIQREFRLLKSDRLFWLSARQTSTKEARAKIILERLQKLIGYCQIMLQD